MTSDRDDLEGDVHDERPFPAEGEWLELPLPEGAAGLPSPDFVARTLGAIAAERALDRDLDALERDLPRIVLRAYEAPTPRHDFVDGTLSRVRDDRRARWQRLLARHVAPTPSAAFVERTLQALRVDRERAGTAGGDTFGETSAPGREHGAAARRWRDGRWALLAAAAALVLWLLWPRPEAAPLQERLAAAATPAMAHAWTSPSAVLLAADSDRRDPDALRAGAPDGVWLAFAPGPTARVH